MKHLLILAACAVSIVSASAGGKPNIVLLMADDMGFSDIGCYGGELNTPVLDALAAEGVRFSSFFNNAKCAPTRASLMTGRVLQPIADPPEKDLPTLRTDNNVTLAEMLKEGGYSTYHVGKWHLGRQNGKVPTDRGFDLSFETAKDARWNGYKTGVFCGKEINKAKPAEFSNPDYQANYYGPIAHADCAKSFLSYHRETRSKQPFFLYLGFSVPHDPQCAPVTPEYVAEKSAIYSKGWHRLREERFERQKAMGLFPGQTSLPPICDLFELPDWSKGEVKEPAYSYSLRMQAIYCKMVEEMDRGIGKVVDYLKAEGLYDDTIFVFLADNGAAYARVGMGNDIFGGEPKIGKALDIMGTRKDSNNKLKPTLYRRGIGWPSLSNTPFRLYKSYVHNGGIATPLVFSWKNGLPSAGAGKWITQRGHVIDIAPTLLAAAGVEYVNKDYAKSGELPASLDGINLMPQITGTEKNYDRRIFLEHQTGKMLIDGKWKFVTRRKASQDGSAPADTEELYNLDEDPFELNNLACFPEASPRIRKMINDWNAWSSEWRDVLPAHKPKTYTP
ncbi:sulfatase-like hydrolase/transferase [Pontiella sulfatireligans]|uniref:Arylsulfatase n=1 Tax=Pontiella sulfatireligans TaxID=2750658 RepID=A0A6C2UR27_9BACT|nr:sulfatase-like hydrolase/transferase [Pontiella sulfatireligans]SPS74527.1 sulfatase S1_4 [Kiritimatiellales bacterium]VGO22688.1 Arylsulfatase [Pontiella sulfatireligans]